MIRRVIGYAGIALGIAVFAAAILAYLVTSFDPKTQQVHDGLGRLLVASPPILRLVLPMDNQFPGWGWWAADFVWFWGGLTIAYQLATFGFKDQKPKVDSRSS